MKNAPIAVVAKGAKKHRLEERRQRRIAARTSANKQSKHRAQSRPRPSANCRFDGSVGVHSVAKPPSGTVKSPIGQLQHTAHVGQNSRGNEDKE